MSDIGSWMRRQGAPVTIGIVAVLVALSLVLSSADVRTLTNFVFVVPGWEARPWTLVTYPWLYPLGGGLGLLWLIFFVVWMFWVGTSVERELGSARYGLFMLAMTVVPALALWLGATSLRGQTIVSGPLLPEAGLTVAWCTRNQAATIMIYGILPLSGKWLGWLTAAGILVMFAAGSPILGILACVHLGLAWAFASNRLPVKYGSGGAIGFRNERVHATRAQARYDETYYDEVRRREKDREERERLRKLFEDSLKDDKES